MANQSKICDTIHFIAESPKLGEIMLIMRISAIPITVSEHFQIHMQF